MVDRVATVPHRTSTSDRVRDRLALVSLAISVGRAAFAGIAALWLVAALLVPASAVALGVLVGRVVELDDRGARVPASALAGPVVALSTLFLSVLVVERVLVTARARLEARVEARIH